MMEVDILFLKQIELTYLPKVRKLLYLLSINAPCAPHVSQLSKEIQTSRATVVNYIKYLKDARLINMLYPINEEFPKKPAMVEAVALNLADNADAQMETLTELFDAAPAGNEWLGYNRFFESNIRRTGDFS